MNPFLEVKNSSISFQVVYIVKDVLMDISIIQYVKVRTKIKREEVFKFLFMFYIFLQIVNVMKEDL